MFYMCINKMIVIMGIIHRIDIDIWFFKENDFTLGWRRAILSLLGPMLDASVYFLVFGL